MVPSRQGFDFAYASLAVANCRGNTAQAQDLAERKGKVWGPGPLALLKSPVTPNTTADWPVIQSRMQFAQVIRQASLLGRAGFLEGVLNAKQVAVADEGSASWVAESALKPVTTLALTDLGRMTGHKVEAVVVLTDELVRASDATAATVLLGAMKNSCAYAMDRALADPANAGDDSKPASLAAQGAIIPSSGDFVADLISAFAALVHPENGVILCNAKDAVKIATLTTTGAAYGAPVFPDMGPRGGDMMGVPAYTATGVPEGVVMVVDVSQVFAVNESPVVTYSDEALVVMGNGEPISLWSADLHAWRIEQVCDWQAAPNSVATITGALSGVSAKPSKALS